MMKITSSLMMASVLIALTGCKAPAAAGESSTNTANAAASQTNAAASQTNAAASQIVVGTLSMKGSEFNAWWALADDQGRVWRLVTTGEEQKKLLGTMQHKRVEVTGKPMGKMLANEQLQIEKLVLVK